MASGGYTNGGVVPTTTFATPSNKDFQGVPFDLAMGEIYGLRMWKVDEYGRLRARTWTSAPPWKPGINTAKCLNRNPSPPNIVDPSGRGRHAVYVSSDYTLTSPSYGAGMGTARLVYTIHWNDGTTERTDNIQVVDRPTGHEVPTESCACGFYAYTEDRHADTLGYKDSNVVLGVIRGTGRTLIGSKGFRCEKAEIVALRDPTRGGTKTDSWRKVQKTQLERVYPDVPLLAHRADLLDFAPIEAPLPDPSSEDFWALP